MSEGSSAGAECLRQRAAAGRWELGRGDALVATSVGRESTQEHQQI